MNNTVISAKNALDSLIRKSRVHLYKPIQIAEVLYRDRSVGDIDISNLETYRSKSKKWRDDVSIELLGRKCTSSSKFQDNLFENNAIPPSILIVLREENNRTDGAVEAYIYNQVFRKHIQLSTALNYCLSASTESFDVRTFLNSFWDEPGLKRSLDKIYEIVVHSLFSSLIEVVNLQTQVFVNEDALPILQEFQDFSRKVIGINPSDPALVWDAHIYRVGVTNAADRGLDMYSTWGPAIQIKHLSLDVELAENIVDSISSDKIVIVCKDAERAVIASILNQIGLKDRIQGIVTEDDLVVWYEKALRGTYSAQIGGKLLENLCEEIGEEFPSIVKIPQSLIDRHYENISDPFWISGESL